MYLRPGVKDEGFLSLFSWSFRLKLMSEGAQGACRDCGGKFRGVTFGNLCEVCNLTLRIRSHLLSSRYPPQGLEAAVAILRESLWKLLEHSDNYWTYQEYSAKAEEGKGGEKSSERSSKEKPGSEPNPENRIAKEEFDKTPVKAEPSGSHNQAVAGLSGKAAPPKPPLGVEEPPSEETGKKKNKENKRSKSPRHRRERSDRRRRKKRTRKSKSGRGRTPKQRREKPEVREERSPPRSGSESGETSTSEPPIPRPSRAGDRKPRSPSKSPPPRVDPGYYTRDPWPGPILAKRKPSQTEHPAWSPPRGTNKGTKKRRQQDRAREYGGWNNRARGRGWR